MTVPSCHASQRTASFRNARLDWKGKPRPRRQAPPHAVRWYFRAKGRVPRSAQRRVILFFCRTWASSWNQSSSGLPLAAVIAARMFGDRRSRTGLDHGDARLPLAVVEL